MGARSKRGVLLFNIDVLQRTGCVVRYRGPVLPNASCSVAHEMSKVSAEQLGAGVGPQASYSGVPLLLMGGINTESQFHYIVLSIFL